MKKKNSNPVGALKRTGAYMRSSLGIIIFALVLAAYLDGKSYQEIADNLGRHVKSIDNALQRVKRKLERYLEDMEAQNND